IRRRSLKREAFQTSFESRLTLRKKRSSDTERCACCSRRALRRRVGDRRSELGMNQFRVRILNRQSEPQYSPIFVRQALRRSKKAGRQQTKLPRQCRPQEARGAPRPVSGQKIRSSSVLLSP